MFRNYIEAISNEVVSWDSIREKFVKDNGITYADPEIAAGKGAHELKNEGNGKWVVGSTLCLNLKHIDKIPAFYNPEGARGEDAFFSIRLDKAKVIKIPVYHFHDGFLNYSSILRGKYPKNLRKIKVEDEKIAQRFIQASRGWIKYKPLLLYVTNQENYREKMNENYEKLKAGIPEVNKLFESEDCNVLLDDMKKYDKNVKKHYEEYLKTNEIWEKLKRNK